MFGSLRRKWRQKWKELGSHCTSVQNWMDLVKTGSVHVCTTFKAYLQINYDTKWVETIYKNKNLLFSSFRC